VGKCKNEILDSGKWDCEMCKSEIICLMEKKIKNVLIETEDIKVENCKVE
jgi:hypothetical protein